MEKKTTTADYSSFLNGFNPDTDSLAKLALDNVLESRLSSGTLEKYGVKLFSGNGDELKKLLCFSSINGNPLLKICRLIQFPNYSEDGSINGYEVKTIPTIDGHKYLQEKGKPSIPYILPDVWAVKDKANKPLWITEGRKKVLKLIQEGRLCVGLSGVWNFKAGKDSIEEESKPLWREFSQFQFRGRTVYPAFDSDLWTNPQVRYAFWELVFKLIARGAVVRFPVWQGAKGIDDYLAAVKDPEKELQALEGKAIPLEKFITPEHKDEIMRAISEVQADMDSLSREILVNTIAKRFNVRPKRLYMEIENRTKSKEIQGYSEDEKERAYALLKDPDLIKRFLEVCHTRYIGRDKTLILVKLATLTRHFNKGLSVVLSGTSSCGKSFLVDTVLKTVDPQAIENFTRTSAQYLLYRSEELAHKVVTYYELQGTGKTAEIIRTALSEGELVLGTVMKDPQGTLKSMKIEKDTRGLVILSTHTGYRLDHELSTRVLSQEITHSEELARAVYNLKAGGSNND